MFPLRLATKSLRPLLQTAGRFGRCGLQAQYRPSIIKPISISEHLRYVSNAQGTSKNVNTTAPKSQKASGRKPYTYPEQLLIYHAGTGRTVFIGCMKVTTLFVFAFFVLVVTPTYISAPDVPYWMVPAVIAAGTVPLFFVGYTTAPFVTYIHLHLPTYARHSREILKRYTTALPKDALIDITTMTHFGRPRVTRMKISELYRKSGRLGIANYARDTAAINKKRPWYLGKTVSQFGINSGSGLASGPGRTRERGIWEIIEKSKIDGAGAK